MAPRQIATEILTRVYKDNVFVDVLMHREFHRSDLSNLDKSFISELVHGTLRWQGKLDWILKQFYQGDFEKCPRIIKIILEASLYQILYMSKTPEFAAVNEGVRLAQKMKGRYWGNRVNAILRNYLRQRDCLKYPDLAENPIESISVRYSHPQWLVKRWIKRYGVEETQLLCASNNEIPDLTLRVNPLKTSSDRVIHELTTNGITIEVVDELEGFLNVSHTFDIAAIPGFQKGYFTVQDVSAGLVGLLLDPLPGETILDLCAAPGGKSTHIAELTKDHCTIIAVDQNRQRLNLLKQNIRRLDLSSIHPVQADATMIPTHLVDKVLVDAPCSGLGVIAKRSDLRWKRTPEDIEILSRLQRQLVQNAAKLVKPGGILVYSTCTIEPEENESVIEEFLRQHSEFLLDIPTNRIPEKYISESFFIKILPHKHQIDGSFAARFVRKK